MLSRAIKFRPRSQCFATFAMHEEYPHHHSHGTSAAPVNKESVLSNGVRVFSKYDSNSKVANISVTVLAGSRNETWEQKGSAHFLSSTAFSGTTKRSGLRLFRDLENAGVDVSASADREKIVYEGSVHVAHAETAAKGLLESVANYKYNSHKVIDNSHLMENKYAAAGNCSYSQLDEMVHEAAYGERSSLASRFNEDVHNLCDVTVDAFHTANFVAGNVIVSASGVQHEDLVRWSEAYLKDLSASAPKAPAATPYRGGYLQIRKNLGGASYMSLAFPQPADKNSYCVLRSYLRNRLAESSATSGVQVFSSSRSDGGIWGFIVGGETSAAVQQLHGAIEALKKVNGGINIDGAKNASTLAALLSADSHGAGALSRAATGHSADYSAVTAASVEAAAKASLQAHPSFAVLGQTFGVPSFENVAKALK